MKQPLQSPWLGVSLAVAGLVVGYSVVVLGSDASFAAVECPAGKQACLNGECDTAPECASGQCSKDCPGNCPMHTS